MQGAKKSTITTRSGLNVVMISFVGSRDKRLAILRHATTSPDPAPGGKRLSTQRNFAEFIA
jgi:hypothetical protein